MKKIFFPFLVFLIGCSTLSIVGDREFTYTQKFTTTPLRIGSSTFLAEEPMYLCGLPETTQFSYIKPIGDNDKCWKVDVSYEGKDYTMYHGSEVLLNKYLSVKYLQTGKIYYTENGSIYFKRASDWTNSFNFKLVNDDFLRVSYIISQPNVLLSQNQILNISIYNDLADNVKGGLYVKTIKNMLFSESNTKYPLTLKRGDKFYSVPLSAETLGKVTLEIQPFITIDVPNANSITLMVNEPITYTYTVVPNVSSVGNGISVDCSNKACPTGFICQTGSYNGKDFSVCMKGEKVEQPIDNTVNVLPQEQKKVEDNVNAIILVIIVIITAIVVSYLIILKPRKK